MAWPDSKLGPVFEAGAGIDRPAGRTAVATEAVMGAIGDVDLLHRARDMRLDSPLLQANCE